MRKVKNVFVGTILTVWYTIEMMWFKTNVCYWVYTRHHTVAEYVIKYGDLYKRTFHLKSKVGKTRGYKIAMNSIYGSRSMKQKLSNKWREDLQNYITEHYKPE